MDLSSPLGWLAGALEEGRPGAYDFAGDVLNLVALDRRSNQLARFLGELGVRPGDRVAAMLENSADAVVAWFGSTKASAVFVPVNTGLRGEFLRHQVVDCDPTVLIVEERYVERFSELVAAGPSLRVCLVRGAHAGPVFSGVATADLAAQGSADTSPVGSIPDPATLSHLIYTSGTTGRAKGCMVSHNYLCNLARQSLANSGRGIEEGLWTPLPLFHVAGMSYATQTLLLEATTSVASHFSVTEFWPEVERTGVRIVSAVGTVLGLIANASDTEVSLRCRGQLRAALGAPLSEQLQRIWVERFGVERVGVGAYGMSEASLMTMTGSLPLKAGSAGVPSDSFEVRIVDAGDRDVPTGKPGEIICRPRLPHVMFEGYWRNPEATVAALRNLWFHTGDVARFDDDHYLYFMDRRTDVLRRGGENMASGELERAVLEHPALLEAAVHAVPSEVGEDEVKLTAVLRPDASVEPADLFVWLSTCLPRFAVPRYIEVRGDLPKNPVGRVMKFQLRQEGVTPETWDRLAAGLSVPR